MIFKFSMKLYFLLSIIAILIINSVQAKEKPTTDVEKDTGDVEKTGTDDYYLVVVKHKVQKKKRNHEKRHEREEILDSLVSQINNLIMDNRDTYDDPTELEAIEQIQNPESLRRRGLEEDEEENNYAYVISSLEKQSIIVTYLSESLVSLVENLEYVKYVVPDAKLTLAARTNDELKRLKSSNAWKNPCVKGNTYNYLSIISQDKYNDSKKNASYDKNYYYPGSAGEGTNIFILDTGFNFTHPEFSNKDERKAKCIAATTQMMTTPLDSEACYYGEELYHGNMVADIAGGLTNGVASKANIYGIAIYSNNRYGDITMYASSVINALTYIDENYLSDPKYLYKTIINISAIYSIEYPRNPEGRSEILEEIINNMSKKGVVFVAASGNLNESVDDMYYPCSFGSVICVGSIDNANINDIYEEKDKNEENKKIFKKTLEENIKSKDMLTKYYRRASYSNYGKNVNLYAPGAVKVNYYDENGREQEEYGEGTSFSSPIVAGIVATIMSEFPYYNFNTEKMLEHLVKIGVPNVIKGLEKGHPNVLVNNGKHINYSQYDKYNSCGNPTNELCSKDDELECFEHGCCLKA